MRFHGLGFYNGSVWNLSEPLGITRSVLTTVSSKHPRLNTATSNLTLGLPSLDLERPGTRALRLRG